MTPLRVSLRWGGDQADQPVGRLAARDRRTYFEFAPAFLAAPSPISPMRLAPRSGVIEGPPLPFDGLFGVFDDSLPDGWGRLLIHRRAARQGLDRLALQPLDLLAYIGEWAMGALIYQPERDSVAPSDVLDLDVIAEHSRDVLAGAPDQLFPELLRVGGSPAGARPKALVLRRPEDGHLRHGTLIVEPGYQPWLVKFRGRDDPRDIGPIEFAYALMARSCGIVMAETLLLPSGGRASPYFATRRFDRVDADGRLHLHSASGLLQASHRDPTLDYRSLIQLAYQITRDRRAAVEMYRRMVFNVLAHNRDDHGKQFSFLMVPTGTWQLAPAYDLTFAAGVGGEHATMIGGEGRDPQRADLLKLAPTAGLGADEAASIIDEVADAVGRWRGFADQAGVGRASRDRIGKAIVPHHR